jgi:hypothetical protein
MISTDTLRIIRQLLEKTRERQVGWAEAQSPVTSRVYSFVVRFDLARSSVTLARLRDDQTLRFRLANEDGAAVISEDLEPGDQGYAELEELIILAFRQSRKVDETLLDLESFLREEKKRSR